MMEVEKMSEALNSVFWVSFDPRSYEKKSKFRQDYRTLQPHEGLAIWSESFVRWLASLKLDIPA